jgi:hypothetical protein
MFAPSAVELIPGWMSVPTVLPPAAEIVVPLSKSKSPTIGHDEQTATGSVGLT